MKIVSNIFAVELILSNKTFDALHLTYIGFFSLSVLCICVCCTFFAALFFHSKQWSAITQTLSKSLTNYQLRKSLASKVTLKFIQANLIRDFNARNHCIVLKENAKGSRRLMWLLLNHIYPSITINWNI